MTHQSFKAMGSPCALTILGHNESETLALMDMAKNEIARLEQKYSRYLPTSLISQINQQAGKNEIKCDSETAQLIDFAFKTHTESKGLFDITSGVFRRIWNFNEPRLPSNTETAQMLELVGMKHIDWDGKNIFLKKEQMELDLGGLVKEYAADRVALLLYNAGAKSSLINLSGDVMATGPKPSGEPWRVGVKHPRDPSKVLATFPLEFGALASSGDYERAFILDSARYCHLINPQTGWPVNHWQSVSVAARSCLLAGSHSSCAMLMQEEGLAYLHGAKLAFCAMDQQGRVFHA
jgi:thiamine biosynthesis lipoprotein